jgi:acyl carrier protein
VSDLRARIIDRISEVVGSPADEVTRVGRFADLGSWDSLKHINAVLALEQEFGVHFDLEEFVLLDSVDRAVELVQRKTPA